MLNIDLSDAPKDPIERLVWLSGVKSRVDTVLESEYRDIYFRLRLEHRLEDALSLKYHSRKRALAMTRAHNHSMGNGVRWSDGLDSTSSAYRK